MARPAGSGRDYTLDCEEPNNLESLLTGEVHQFAIGQASTGISAYR